MPKARPTNSHTSTNPHNRGWRSWWVAVGRIGSSDRTSGKSADCSPERSTCRPHRGADSATDECTYSCARADVGLTGFHCTRRRRGGATGTRARTARPRIGRLPLGRAAPTVAAGDREQLFTFNRTHNRTPSVRGDCAVTPLPLPAPCLPQPPGLALLGVALRTFAMPDAASAGSSIHSHTARRSCSTSASSVMPGLSAWACP